jgi:hypothetical protein
MLAHEISVLWAPTIARINSTNPSCAVGNQGRQSVALATPEGALVFIPIMMEPQQYDDVIELHTDNIKQIRNHYS